MRLAAYAGASVALAAGVFVKALHQRSNFYSACVYLSQSSANLMVGVPNFAVSATGNLILTISYLDLDEPLPFNCWFSSLLASATPLRTLATD
jgi:hypothetical protein